MTDLVTRDLTQLPKATAISAEALMPVQEPTAGAPMVALAVRDLLGRLIQTDEATPTEAALLALLAYPENSIALVYADPDATKNGWYRKSGASGAGTWTRFEKLADAAAAELQALVDEVQSLANEVGDSQIALALQPAKLGLPGRKIDLSRTGYAMKWGVGNPASIKAGLAMASDFSIFARATSAWEVDATGVIAEVAANIAAIRHNAQAQKRGVRIAPAFTNRFAHPRDFRLTAPAYWLDEASTDIQHNVLDSPFGPATGSKMVALAASGQKQLRQNRPVTAGNTYMDARLVKNEGCHARISFPATQFGTGGIIVNFDLFTGQGTVASTTQPVAFGSVDYGKGWWLIWAVGLCISTSTGASSFLYALDAAGATNWTGDGVKGLGICWAFNGENVIRPPAAWHSTGLGPSTIAASTWTVAEAGALVAAALSIDNADGEMLPGKTALARYVDANNCIRVREANGFWRLEAVKAGAVTGYVTGDAVEKGVQRIVVAIDENAGRHRWEIDGVTQPTLLVVGGPTGLTTWGLGCDGGGNQIGCLVNDPVTGIGAPLAADLKAESGEAVAASVNVPSEMVMEASANRVSVYRRQYDNVWLGKDIDRVATGDYQGVTYADGWYRGATRECQLVSGVMQTVKVREIAGAEDDSMAAADRISPNAFWAIGAHGDWLKGRASRFLLDGMKFTPGDFRSGLIPLQRLDLQVEADAWHPDRIELCAKKSHELTFLPDRTEYAPEWRWLVAMDIDGGSYLAMRESQTHELPVSGGLYNQGALWLDTAWTEESPFLGQSILPGIASPVTTNGKRVRLSGPDRWWCELELLAGPCNRMFPKRSNNTDTTNGKIYPALGAAGSTLQTQVGARWFGRFAYREGVLRP